MCFCNGQDMKRHHGKELNQNKPDQPAAAVLTLDGDFRGGCFTFFDIGIEKLKKGFNVRLEPSPSIFVLRLHLCLYKTVSVATSVVPAVAGTTIF